jgi:hypothetical protein
MKHKSYMILEVYHPTESVWFVKNRPVYGKDVTWNQTTSSCGMYKTMKTARRVMRGILQRDRNALVEIEECRGMGKNKVTEWTFRKMVR